MEYTVTWEQLAFSDYTWSSVLKQIPKVVTCKFIKTLWDFILKEGDDKVRVERYPPQYVYTMTYSEPFVKDLIKALILMVEFGGAKIMTPDDRDMSIYLDALDEVHSICRLTSYEQQRDYFLSVNN